MRWARAAKRSCFAASPGLAPGASQTFYSGHDCLSGPHHAVVDPMDEVKESDESNNTADIDALC